MRLTATLAVAAVVLLAAGCPTERDAKTANPDVGDIPADKQTTLGLYLTARQAHEMWRADPDRISLLDVRTPAEYIFVGHPRAAHNVPYEFLTFRYDPDKGKPVFEANPGFVNEVRRRFRRTDTLLVFSRSGKRGAKAVNALAAAGFTNAYSIIDGFEGDEVTDPAGADLGKRTRNGWRNSGAPWTYDLDPDLMYLPSNG